MTAETRSASKPPKPKTKTKPKPTEHHAIVVDLKTRVKELSLSGKTPVEIARTTGKSKTAIYQHLKQLAANGEIDTYKPIGADENRKWYKIIERAILEQEFYDQQRITPTARKVVYRLLEKAVAAKEAGATDEQLQSEGLPLIPTADTESPEFKKFKSRFAKSFYNKAADARRGINSTYTRLSYLPKMDIDCYRDGRNLTPIIGYLDIDEEPEEPTPDKPPEHPIAVAENAIEDCKDTILDYDGSVIEGNKGKMPGIWYNQPVIPEIWCESDTIHPDFKKFQNELDVLTTDEDDDIDEDVIGWNVKVATSKGMPSVPFIYESCKRLQELADSHDHIEKFAILYFGDSDKGGKHIANCIENAIRWYCSGKSPDFHVTIPIEFRHIAITKDQIKKYRLTGSQLEAFLTTSRRIKQLKEEILLPALKSCWSKKIYKDNCPSINYDYKANNEKEPESINPDALCKDVFKNVPSYEAELTVRQKMGRMASDAFPLGWESRLRKKQNDEDDSEDDE